MKYIDVDKLIAELERWRDKAKEDYNKNHYSMGRCDALAEFRNYIVSLQENLPEINKYIDSEKLKYKIEWMKEKEYNDQYDDFNKVARNVLDDILDFVTSLQQEEPNHQEPMIQWTGKNLKEVIDFTTVLPKFKDWFKSWEEYENYVHAHNDIFKLFFADGSHYEIPAGAWIIKTPDGHIVPSVANYVMKREIKDES